VGLQATGDGVVAKRVDQPAGMKERSGANPQKGLLVLDGRITTCPHRRATRLAPLADEHVAGLYRIPLKLVIFERHVEQVREVKAVPSDIRVPEIGEGISSCPFGAIQHLSEGNVRDLP
jgi:hypothetical protein